MATLAIQMGGILMGACIFWIGIQGLRGVPDKAGKITGKATAVACLTLGVLLAFGAVFAPNLVGGRW